ncbi:hypothetical protein ACA910_015692 [Epithemia clementina (nom. ined.)]
MLLIQRSFATFILSFFLLHCVLAADNKDDDYDLKDWKNQANYNGLAFDDNIQYWTQFHLRARRCVVFKKKDVIVFELFANGDQCGGDHMVGTYYTPVPYYMQGYMDEVAQKNEDRGIDDYVEPDVAQYQYCTPKEYNGQMVYLQLGCADNTTKSIAVNVYKDNTCETRAPNSYGTDDANFDISEIQVKFKKCQACVNWVNKDDDQIDDQFYEKRQMLAPLCSTAWAYKAKCGKKCQRVGLKDELERWQRPELTLLGFLIGFSVLMGGLIWRKRQKMASKDALLEQAAINAAGLQTTHVVGVACLIVLVITGLALLGLKNITLALILLVNVALFGYLMKLTYETSVGETVVGPDGEILHKADSEDSEDGSRESSVRHDALENNGTYMLPTLT